MINDYEHHLVALYSPPSGWGCNWSWCAVILAGISIAFTTVIYLVEGKRDTQKEADNLAGATKEISNRRDAYAQVETPTGTQSPLLL